MDLKEFREFGYLQEANRRFFHPLGLALGVVEEHLTGTRYLVVQDHRGNQEGMIFAQDDPPEPEKYERVAEELVKRFAVRLDALGYDVQPVEMPWGWER